MISKQQATFVVLIDERSLRSLDLIGAQKQNVAKTTHECSNANEDWGGIPVVVLFGDDYQLHTVIVKVVFAFLNAKGEKKPYFNTKMETKVIERFMSFSENLVELDYIVKQNSNQVHFNNCLKMLRVGWTKKMTEKD
jgi:hypothetical protein